MDKLELEKAYKEHGTIQNTAKYFGYSYGKIRYQLDKYNIPYTLERNTDNININELKQIYKETQSIRKVGEYFNMSHEKARQLLNKHNLCNKLTRYNCNHDFFSLDNQWSFYWAGFIAADGSIDYMRNVLGIGLAQKDKIILETFKQHINAENPIYDYLVKNSLRNPRWNDSVKSEIKITSNKLCEDLKRFNVVPRKSLIYTFPEWLIAHPLVNHFMRGYFDGDGSFFINVGRNRFAKQIYFNLRGTIEFLTIYRLILERECGLIVEDIPIRINCGIGMLEYGGNNIVGKIAKFLYHDAVVYLERKHNIVGELNV
jgi:hypothetical protein